MTPILERALMILVLAFVPAVAGAQLTFCNQTGSAVRIALDAVSIVDGWHHLDPSQCRVLRSELDDGLGFYYHQENSGTEAWDPQSTATICVSRDSDFRHSRGGRCEGVRVSARIVYSVGYRTLTVNLTGVSSVALQGIRDRFTPPPKPKYFNAQDFDYVQADPTEEQKKKNAELHRAIAARDRQAAEQLATAKTGVVQTLCLARWDDSHQVHSTQMVIQWNNQKLVTTMKKLEHCIRLDLTGVTSIDGIAEEYVKQCIDHGLNDQKTRHMLELVLAIYVDKNSDQKTSFTPLKIADYARSAANATVDCLLDTQRITAYLGEKLKDKFKATVREDMQWVYWDL
ncbi:DUF1036 domain-containing protein [Variovorax rhizosphaerae]|uniref:DUF1036 domain-containing protein n=1 Tax=Variovorax rhizosphaerae TaxID=1836200 RepID=A0ABU8WS37_9BURK